MTVLLKDAFNPNLVQTLEENQQLFMVDHFQTLLMDVIV